MTILYQIAWGLFSLLSPLMAIHPKWRKLFQARSAAVKTYSKVRESNKPVLVFHCASLGEYDMIVPLLTAEVREKYFVVAAFFSPSGYNHAKTDGLVNLKCYVPWDRPGSVETYLRLLNPSVYVFVKYDFWLNLMSGLHKRKVKTMLVNGLVQPSAFYFKPLFRSWLKHLKAIDKWFVQDESSAGILSKYGIDAEVTGDLRMDRVLQGKDDAREIPEIKRFKANSKLVLFGSSWPEEEVALNPLLVAQREIKLVVAPHDVSETHIQKLLGDLADFNPVRLSNYDDAASDSRVLIIDGIGLLRDAYQYADIAVVGGGFGRGLHNILEPAVWNIPVITGHEIDRFPEALELQKLGCLKTVEVAQDMVPIIDGLLSDETRMTEIEKVLKDWFENKIPKKDLILSEL